jgi:hypothetical protein
MAALGLQLVTLGEIPSQALDQAPDPDQSASDRAASGPGPAAILAAIRWSVPYGSISC